jgi:hypothetical protein
VIRKCLVEKGLKSKIEPIILTVPVHARFRVGSVNDYHANARRAGEATYRQWMDLDALLVQIWAIYSAGSGREEESREYLEGLLPEVTKKGAAELVYSTDDFL